MRQLRNIWPFNYIVRQYDLYQLYRQLINAVVADHPTGRHRLTTSTENSVTHMLSDVIIEEFLATGSDNFVLGELEKGGELFEFSVGRCKGMSTTSKLIQLTNEKIALQDRVHELEHLLAEAKRQ